MREAWRSIDTLGTKRRNNDMSLLWILLAIWSLSLWWLVGAFLLHINESLPEPGLKQHQAAMFWPLWLLSVRVSRYPDSTGGH